MAKNNAMPYNLEAEQSILGCILIDQVVQPDIITSLKVDDFLVESHRLIFEAIQDVYNSNVPVDLVTLSDILQKKCRLRKSRWYFVSYGAYENYPVVGKLFAIS